MRCIWLDTPLADAQVNLAERLLERFGRLLSPPELKAAARKEPGVLTPMQQMRALRELEPPLADEGFASIERVPFSRAERDGRPGVFVAAAALRSTAARTIDGETPNLVFDWRPDGPSGDLEALAASLPAPAELAVCTHPGGPPTCWCRPPLPGLVLEFARRHSIDPASSVVVGASPAHRTLANALGARYVDAGG